MKILATGGAGFIGSHLCRLLLAEGHEVTCFDKLDTRVVNPFSLTWMEHPRLRFICGDILNVSSLMIALRSQDVAIHAAAQSSVDKSIREPLETMSINAMGTICLLEAMRRVGVKRFHYVSTDEIFGATVEKSFNEESPLAPTNPYAAGKVSGENALFAWSNTYGLDFTITNGVNNYGPYQAPEKFIPRLTVRGLLGESLPIYGNGRQRREWLHVEDHCQAIWHVLQHGKLGERYCVGHTLEQNINVAKQIVRTLHIDHSRITFVEDRPGHDVGYAINSSKILSLGWHPKITFTEGLEETIL